MILTVITPEGEEQLGLLDDCLIYDGQAFIEPSVGELCLVNSDVGPWQCLITAVDQEVVTENDPRIITVDAPEECFCGITCRGTDIAYVTVRSEND